MEEKLYQWFRQHCFMQRELPTGLMAYYRNAGLTKVEKIKNLIVNEMRFFKGCVKFEYKGPEV